MKHKKMQVIQERDENKPLVGIVEIDGAYLGGVRSGKRGRGAENKTPFVAAVQTTDQSQPEVIKLSVVESFST